MTSFYLRFGDHIVNPGAFIPQELTLRQPQILAIPTAQTVPLTLILYDNTHGIVHWLVVNYLTPNVMELLPYTPMNPPGTEVHQYTLYVLTQRNGLIPYIQLPGREFNTYDFANSYGLREMASLTYYSAHTH